MKEILATYYLEIGCIKVVSLIKVECYLQVLVWLALE